MINEKKKTEKKPTKERRWEEGQKCLKKKLRSIFFVAVKTRNHLYLSV